MLTEKQNNFETSYYISGDKRSLSSNFISSLEYLDNKHVLVGTRGGLDIYNPEKK